GADFNQGISAMASSFRISSLVPRGLVVESVIDSEDMIKVMARSRASEALCPLCGSISRLVHSRYIRQVADLPCTGRPVALSLFASQVRPLRCHDTFRKSMAETIHELLNSLFVSAADTMNRVCQIAK